MTDTQTLRAAAALMREQHRQSCRDREYVEEVAAWLERVAIVEECGEQKPTPRLREHSTALHVAEGYLARQEAGC